jgi:M6 family metalloprotease-like protein
MSMFAGRMARVRTIIAGAALLSLTMFGALPSAAQTDDPAAALPDDIDPVSHVLPEHMTWDDYRPVPGWDWTDPAHQPPRKIRAALILGDFVDQPFVVEQQGLTDDPADFYKRFLITEPSELNYQHTINEYWLEDSFGLIGVDADAFGPYTLDGKLHEYGITSDMNSPAQDCPQGDTCNKDLDTDLIEASLADVTTGMATNGGRDYDFRYLLHAGWDESGTWEEFGPMLFRTPDEVTNDVDERTGQPLGNPAPRKSDAPHAAKTRYQRPDGPWTSFFSAKQPWAHAVPGVYSAQGESDGASTFAHELSHIFGVLDNYGNPFAENADRDYSGPWDMLSRGTFNGPGGPHNRWHIPANQGATMGAHHMLRTKVRLGFVAPTDVEFVAKDALAAGPVITDILQREQPMSATNRLNGLKYGINVVLGRDTSDHKCPRPGNALCSGNGAADNYDNYTVEVVNRVGYDSFTPDAGVLIAKTKNADLNPFLWVIDSHPDDIGAIDYIKPDGEPQPYRFGDYRQLSDALFKVGRRGTHPELGDFGYAQAGETTNTFIDHGNDLKFLILDRRENSADVLSYRVAVVKASGTAVADVATRLDNMETVEGPTGLTEHRLTLTNSGRTTDIARIAVEGEGTKILNDLVELAPGQTKTVTVYQAPGICGMTAQISSEVADTSATSFTSACGG